MKRRIFTVVGARPQFVKAAVVSLAIKAYSSSNGGISEYLLHTGQHYDPMMSDVFFQELGLNEPDVNLNVGSGPHGETTGMMLARIEAELMRVTPDLMLVYGDTNSTLAGALAAAKLCIPVAHVEAGLRSWDRRMPEEINRIVTDQLSSVLLCPTYQSVANLKREGIEQNVAHVGDVMYDAALMFGKASDASNLFRKHHLAKGEFILCTLHRAANTDDPERLRQILAGLNAVAAERKVFFPVHPRTAHAIKSHRLAEVANRIMMVEPVSFMEMVQLEKHAKVIVTDSGGVQKEAYFHGVPCVTVRDSTEWVELLEAGWNRLCPAEAEALVSAIATAGRGRTIEEYGSGQAARAVVERLVDFLK